MHESKDLELLIRSRYPILVIESVEERRIERLLSLCTHTLQVPLFTWTVVEGLRRDDGSGTVYDTVEPAKALANLRSISGEAVYYFKDLHRFLDDPVVLRTLQDLATLFDRDRRTIVLAGTALQLPPELRHQAAALRLNLPDRAELQSLVRATMDDLMRSQDVGVQVSNEQVAKIIDGLTGLTRTEARRVLTRAALRDSALTADDVARIAREKGERLAAEGLLEPIPVGDGPELAGLENLRSWLSKRRGAFSADARNYGLEAPRGVLLLGVQGCGKSMAARAVARDWQLPLLRFDAGRLLDKYIGESERRLERALATAERMAPCVMLVDEIEKALALDGSQTDGGLSRRIFGRILGWLQDRQAPVFVVATCNSVQQLPPEIMRKGRFDEIFFVDLPNEHERRQILEVHLGVRERDPDGFDLWSLAGATAGFSGAEIEQAIVAAMYSAFADDQELDTGYVLREVESTRPLSVTRAEEIGALRAWASGRAVAATRLAAA